MQLERKVQAHEEALGIRSRKNEARHAQQEQKIDSLAEQVDSRNRRVTARKKAHTDSRNRTREASGLASMDTSNSEAHASIGIQPSSVSSVRQQAKHEVTTSEFADRIAASLRKHKVNKPGCNNATSVKLGKLWEPASDCSEEGAYLSSLRTQRLSISVVDNGARAKKSESQLLAEQRVASLRAAKQKREASAAALAAENAKGHTNNNGQEAEHETIHDAAERWIKPFESGTSACNSLNAERSVAQAPAFMGEFISRDSFEYLRGYVFKMGDKGLGLYWDESGNTLVPNGSCNNNKNNNTTDLFAFGSTENRHQERAKALQDQRGSTQAMSTGFNRHRLLTKTRGGLSSNRMENPTPRLH